MSQPTQSSSRGQSDLQGKARVSKQDPIMDTRQRLREIKNTRKGLWLLTPTQLFSQGQWWSNLSTQRLQIAQWRERGVRRTRQSGHISQG